MKDELGDRMKKNYENRTRILLPRRTYTIIRIDGKAFHTYTKGCVRPFDDDLIEDMNETACYLCKNIQGAKFAYVQSDEISILVTDFEKIGTDAWFDGNIQKIVSISSSLAASKFNQLRISRRCINNNNILTPDVIDLIKLADFDARTFTIPMDVEVENYFIWRQQDCVRNSISSVAQSLYSTEELKNKNGSVQQEMIHKKGKNWNDYPATQKRGRFISKVKVDMETPYVSKDKAQFAYSRNVWVADECPTFTKDRDFLTSRIPKDI